LTTTFFTLNSIHCCNALVVVHAHIGCKKGQFLLRQ